MPLAQEPTAIAIDPRRYMTAVHGPAGVGKTSFCAQITDHYFFYTPNSGVEGVEVYGDPILNWKDFIAKAKEVIEAKKKNFENQRTIKICVIDVLGDLFDYAGAEVCATQRFMEKGVAHKFDKIDDGSIDLLSVDIEGAEWYVIEYMVSRPDIISLETHGAIYINPNINEIEEWLADNNYRIWYMDESDSVYVKNGIVNIGLLDKLLLFTKRILLAIKRSRKRIKRKIKNLFAG